MYNNNIGRKEFCLTCFCLALHTLFEYIDEGFTFVYFLLKKALVIQNLFLSSSILGYSNNWCLKSLSPMPMSDAALLNDVPEG